MKKLFFTAIALVAFSGISMASTVEVKVEKDMPVLNVDCVKVAIAALDAADPNNEMTQAQADKFFQGQLNACYKSTKQLTAN
jgi:hypothetical protein